MLFYLPFFSVITTASELRSAAWDDRRLGDTFSLTCTVANAIGPIRSFSVCDGTGYCYVRAEKDFALRKGDLIRIDGRIGVDPYNWQRAFLESAEKLGRGEVPVPVEATPDRLHDESFDNRTVVMQGVIADVVDDAIDPRWTFLALRNEKGPFLAAVCKDGGGKKLHGLLGATVSLTGTAQVLPDGGKRKFKTPQLTVSTPDDIRIVSLAPEDPFDVPLIPFDKHGIANFQYKSATLLSRMNRRRADGRVIAVLQNRELLLKTENGQIVGARTDNGPMPAVNDSVSVAGFPETDLFMIRLAKAVWKPIPDAETETAADGPARELSSDFDMNAVLRDNSGRTVRITGKVVSAESAKGGVAPRTLTLACGKHMIPIDATSCGEDALPPHGAVAAITGVCVINTSKWTPLDIFPRIDGFTLAPRSAADITVISAPPWWTPRRLTFVIAALLAALAGVFAWNRILGHMIERRSRQLLKSEIARAESNLRIDERTRLSVELHDAVSQTLTGVAFHVDAAGKTVSSDPAAASNYLSVAKRTLLSCREELRRCLWDLRNNTLENLDFAEAIVQTVRPCAGDADVAVRFNVRRSHMSDLTAHAIINITRELTVNAVRHGSARHVWIAGEQKDGTIRFSVKDDGTGFDPESRPGPAQGHFGLQGVKERITKLGGSLTVASAPGSGTKIIVEIRK